jgi:hypothetical protein
MRTRKLREALKQGVDSLQRIVLPEDPAVGIHEIPLDLSDLTCGGIHFRDGV